MRREHLLGVQRLLTNWRSNLTRLGVSSFSVQ
jgi:hypothetical protein